MGINIREVESNAYRHFQLKFKFKTERSSISNKQCRLIWNKLNKATPTYLQLKQVVKQ